MLILISITLLLILCLGYYNKLTIKNVTVFSGKLQILGYMTYFFKGDMYTFFKKVGRHCIQNDGILSFYLGPITFYFIANIEDATIILNKCIEKVFIYELIKPLFGDSLVAAEGIVGKNNRKILDLCFKKKIINNYLNLFKFQAIKLVEVLDKETGKDYFDITSAITNNVLDTCFLTTMGMLPQDGNFSKDQYVKALHRVFEIVTIRIRKFWLLSDTVFKLSALKKELDDSLDIIHKVSQKIVISQKQEYLQKLKSGVTSNEEFRSLLQVLFENTVNENGSVFTDIALRHFCDNILIAGFDTTVYELLFSLICIGSSEEVQDKIYEEIIQVVCDDDMNKEHLTKLVYLDAAIKEALRLYPIGPIVGRKATADLELGKVTLPAGSSIIVHLGAINRNKKYWGEDAHIYRPERWFDAKNQDINAFASFSLGKRNCIGKSYAMMYLKTTLVQIVRKFKINANHEAMILDCNIMLKPKAGHFVKLYLRAK